VCNSIEKKRLLMTRGLTHAEALPNHVLVTGGAGYIGTHTCVELLQAGYQVTVLDNFSNSSPIALDRVKQITGQSLNCIEADVCAPLAVEAALRQSRATAVMHFAGLKAVGESTEHPVRYYDTNVTGTLQLLHAMQACGVRTLVFSSSATVYGEPEYLPLDETHALHPASPYGRSKRMVEQILCDLHASAPDWRLGILRYFNPVGAHSSGHIGEDPQGTPNNLLPFIAQVAVGRRDALNIWGNDYPTADGTGVRDYIHVTDLALGHIATLRHLLNSASGQCLTLNLGTGQGHSVMDMVHAFERASGQGVPYRVQARREGDIAAYYADPTLAEQLLGWKAHRDIHTMCADTWLWQRNNPQGFASKP
jgi:UDP-glucose 4-epimerase